MSVENDDGTSGSFLGMTATAGAFAAMNVVGGQAAAAAHFDETGTWPSL